MKIAEESDGLIVMRNESGGYNRYLWKMPVPGDWTYWDSAARDHSSLAGDSGAYPGQDVS